MKNKTKKNDVNLNTYDIKRTITRTKYRNQQNTNYLKMALPQNCLKLFTLRLDKTQKEKKSHR